MPHLSYDLHFSRHLLRSLRAFCITLSAVLIMSACSANLGQQSAAIAPAANNAPVPQTGSMASKRQVKIAVLLPLAGFDQSAAIAKSMKQAAEMALFERNDPRVQLVVKDDGGTARGAQTAATNAVAEGAEIIIGPLFSSAVPGAALVARQANVPVLALSNDARIAGNGVYLMSFLVEQEVDRIVEYAASRGKRQLAALIPENAYGQIVETAFRNSVARHGAAIRILERYPLKPNGMLKPAQRVMKAIKHAKSAGLPIEALFVPGGQESLPSLGPILAYSGLDHNNIQLLGTGAWDYPNIGREAALVGGWYAGPDPSAWNSFSERFTRTFGHTPPRIASLAYDAVGYAMTLAAEGSGPQPFAAANITRHNGYVGVDGLVQLTPTGRPQRSLAILEVQNFGTTVVDAAPSRLGPQTVSSISY